MKRIVTESSPVVKPRSVLDGIVREGAEKMLACMLEKEIGEFLERHGEIVDSEGRREIVRNGYLPEREVLTGAGALRVKQPRVADRRDVAADDKVRFSSSILPPYLRRSKNIDDLIPWLYLRGISTGGFSDALQALVGPEAKGLIGILDGFRESEQSWRELLCDLKARGLKKAPKVAVGDGALGFWKALRKVFPKTRMRLSLDGVQARLRCREKMATPQWIGATRKTARRLQVRRWNHARKGRRLIIVRTQDLTVSPMASASPSPF